MTVEEQTDIVPESRELTWNLGIQSVEQTQAEASALDSKAMGTLGFASIIIGVFSALASDIKFDCTLIPFAISAVAYIVSAGWWSYALLVR